MDYTANLPPKLSQTRTTTGGYARGAQPAGSGRITPMREAAVKMALQPAPVAEPVNLGQGENGFVGEDLPSNPEDSQSQQTDAPPIDDSTEAPEVAPTTAAPPPSDETTDPVPGDADPGPTGGAEAPGYQGLTDNAHPRGYPSN